MSKYVLKGATTEKTLILGELEPGEIAVVVDKRCCLAGQLIIRLQPTPNYVGQYLGDLSFCTDETRLVRRLKPGEYIEYREDQED